MALAASCLEACLTRYSAARGRRAAAAVRAVGLGAVRVQAQRMVDEGEAARLGHRRLKEITFRMYMSQTAFVDEEDNWKIEAGDILLQLGSSSQDIRLQERIRITDDAWLEGRDRRFRAESRIR